MLSLYSGYVSSDSDSEESKSIEEIIVTAQFREQNLQDTPISITAISGDMLEQRGQVKLSDIASNAPNVTLTPSAGGYGPSMGAYIRGVGQYDFNPALEPGVGIYIDDVYYGAVMGSQFDLLDLQRVEILRGPQGTLAGKNSIGGAVKLYSKKPSGENGGVLGVTVGRYDRLDLQGSVDFSISDNLAFRLTGLSRQNDGYITRKDYGCTFPDSGVAAIMPLSSDCELGKEGGGDTTAARLMVAFDPTDNVSLTFSADISEQDKNTDTGVLISGGNSSTNTAVNGVPLDSRFFTGGSYTNYATYVNPATTWKTQPPFIGNPYLASFDGNEVSETRFNGRSKIESSGFSFNASIDLSDTINIESITAYRDYDTDFNMDTDASPTSTQITSNSVKYEQKSQEFRVNGTFYDASINYTLGLFYLDQDTSLTSLIDIRSTPYPLVFVGDSPELPAKTKAVFSSFSWDLSEALSLNLGLRYTEEEKQYNFVRETKDGQEHPLLGDLNGYSSNYEGDNVDWRVNAQYRFSPSVMAFASVSTGVKGGGIGPRPFNVYQALPFNQEEVTTYEVGMKADLFDNALRLNLAYFFNDYSDIQLSLRDCNNVIGVDGLPLSEFNAGTPCALPQNAGDAEAQGIELEATYQLENGMSAELSVSTLDFEYTKLNPGLAGSIPENGITPYTPELKWNLGLSHELVTSVGTFSPRVDVTYQDSIYTSPTNLETSAIDERTLSNAKLTWTHPNDSLSATLGVNNLTNKYYYANQFDLLASNGTVVGSPGRPREWYFSIKNRF